MLEAWVFIILMFVKVERQCWLKINVQEVSLQPDTRNISIGQSGKMATWPPLQHNWPWPIAMYRSIDSCETISIECHLLL